MYWAAPPYPTIHCHNFVSCIGILHGTTKQIAATHDLRYWNSKWNGVFGERGSQCLAESGQETAMQQATLLAKKACEGYCTWSGCVCESPNRQRQVPLLLSPSSCVCRSVWNKACWTVHSQLKHYCILYLIREITLWMIKSAWSRALGMIQWKFT